MYLSDSYKAKDNNDMMINMSAAIVSQSSSISNDNSSTNTAELIYLVALFYGKGDVSTANALLRSINV